MALERSVAKRFSTDEGTHSELEEYLSALHLEDLALACACAEGYVTAWEHFVTIYRGYLRAAAAAILHCRAGSAEANEFADSLFADLYGLVDAKPGERSLFRYFHGRSSLKTWLRAVLAQRHVDALRANRRFEPLEDDESDQSSRKAPLGVPIEPGDPHRQRYLTLFSRALQMALARLDPRDAQRLQLYYAQQQTLAEVGRQLDEHESSVSRNLERTRCELRGSVEEILRRGFPEVDGSPAEPGLSDAEMALCFEYAAEDVPIDLDKLPWPRSPEGPAARKGQT